MNQTQTTLLYHFCRLRLPAVALPLPVFEHHLQRAFELNRAKQAHKGETIVWDTFLENLYAVDWFLACACLEGQSSAWEILFAARANRTDCLLIDAMRLRAVRLYPRDPERQEEAVAEFWGFLLAGEREGSLPILARYDGQRPLVPWLIRVFQNKHLSELRHRHGLQPLPEDELSERDPRLRGSGPRTLARRIPPGSARMARRPVGTGSTDPRPASALSPQPARGGRACWAFTRATSRGKRPGYAITAWSRLASICVPSVGQATT